MPRIRFLTVSTLLLRALAALNIAPITCAASVLISGVELIWVYTIYQDRRQQALRQ